MGADIHMFICKNQQIIAEDLYDGRNYRWFDNLNDNIVDDEYYRLVKRWGISPQAPDDFIDEYGDEKNNCYYGQHYINVKDFKDWFIRYRPDKKAGWFDTYDKWIIENKGYIPSEPQYHLYKDDIVEDMHFVEYIDEYEPSSLIYEYLIEHDIDDDADIVYCFDC